MEIAFEKYHGTGNDFIIIDNRQKFFHCDERLIRAMCRRRFGIGSDGLILLENDPDSDFYMRYFNADGRESSLCGNGGRCIVAFAHRHGLIERKTRFKAIDGLHHAKIEKDNTIWLKMRDVRNWKQSGGALVLDTGSPHYVTFVEDVDIIDVELQGRTIRNSPPFKAEGINVNFVSDIGNIRLRTYERGVEAETCSCGTGTVAAALALAIKRHFKSGVHSLTLHTRGGHLTVNFELNENGIFSNIWLQGPADYVFSGVYPVKNPVIE